ncbi:MAG TPA: hypothetical protein VMY37_40405 [Thermoguttaceae bacterium]|nr:hypothetical protein [Thermoguttaceae bacterium]
MSGRKRWTSRDLRAVPPSPGLTVAPSAVALLLSLFFLGSSPAAPLGPPPANARQRSARSAVSAKLIRYAQRLLDQFDRNGDGRLDEAEWTEMLLDKYDKNWDGRLGPDEWDETRIARYDRNQNGLLEETEWRRIWITQRLPRSDGGVGVEQLVRAIAALGGGKPIVLKQSHLGERMKPLPLLSPATAGDTRANGPESPAEDTDVPSTGQKPVAGSPSGRGARNTKFVLPRSQLPRRLPPWFVPRDADGDGQLTMAEYAPKATAAQLAEFTRYDRNGDGVLTAEECARGPRPTAEETAEEAEKAEEEAAKQPGEKAEEKAAEQPGEEAAEDTGQKTGNQTDEPTEENAKEAAAARAAALKKLRLQQRARNKNPVKKPSAKPTAKPTSKSGS